MNIKTDEKSITLDKVGAMMTQVTTDVVMPLVTKSIEEGMEKKFQDNEKLVVKVTREAIEDYKAKDIEAARGIRYQSFRKTLLNSIDTKEKAIYGNLLKAAFLTQSLKKGGDTLSSLGLSSQAANVEIKKFEDEANKLLESANPFIKEKAAFLAGQDIAGGFLIPAAIDNNISRIALSVGMALNLCREVTLENSTSLSIPVSNVGYMGNIIGLDGWTNSENPAFSQVTLFGYTWQIVFILDKTLLDMAAVNLVDWLTILAGEAYANIMDYWVLSGQSFANQNIPVGTGNQYINYAYKGLYGNAGVPTISMSTGNTTFASLSATDLIQLPYNLKDSIKNRVFVMHRTILALVRTLKDQAGRFLFNNYYPLLTDAQYSALPNNSGMINELPVYTSDWLPSAGQTGVGKRFILCGSFDYITISKGQLQVDQYTNGALGGPGTADIALKNQIGIIIKRINTGVVIEQPTAFVWLSTSSS